MATDNKLSLQIREDKILDMLLHAATREDIGRLDAKIDRLDAKIEENTTRLNGKIEENTIRLNGKIDEHALRLDTKIDTCVAKLDSKLNQIIFSVGFVILIQIFFHFLPHS
jgi:hypothetical protein